MQSSACALFQYNCTPDTLCNAYWHRLGLIHTHRVNSFAIQIILRRCVIFYDDFNLVKVLLPRKKDKKVRLCCV